MKEIAERAFNTGRVADLQDSLTDTSNSRKLLTRVNSIRNLR